MQFLGLEPEHPAHLATVQAGMDIVENALPIFAQLPAKYRVLMDHAHELVQDLRRLESTRGSAKNVLAVVVWYRISISGVVSRDCRPVQWLVPENMVSKELVNKGVLGYMTKESEMTATKANRCFVMHAFKTNFRSWAKVVSGTVCRRYMIRMWRKETGCIGPIKGEYQTDG